MLLYHLSLEVDNIIKLFSPQIPNEIFALEDGEDLTIPRICVSKSIEGCCSAAPWGGYGFENEFEDSNEIMIRVYEFDSCDIEEQNLITSKELYEKDLVRDSNYTEEYWIINQSIKPKKSYLINIKDCDYEEECVDNISFKDLKHCEEVEEDYENCINGTFIIIKNIKYSII